jgi:hypothetical protein
LGTNSIYETPQAIKLNKEMQMVFIDISKNQKLFTEEVAFVSHLEISSVTSKELTRAVCI